MRGTTSGVDLQELNDQQEPITPGKVVRLAALQMYDPPYFREANDRLWREIAIRLKEVGIADVPANLTRGTEVAQVWHHPRMLLSQTCGYPFVTELQGKVRLVATPRYTSEGCRGPFYRAAIIVRREDTAAELSQLKGQRCAVNDLSSNSGMNLFRATIAPFAQGKPFFNSVLVTGSHAESVKAVAEQRADVASIDCVTLGQLNLVVPDLINQIRILAWSEESPGLPLITAASTDDETVAAIRGVLENIERDPNLRELREELFIDGFEVLNDSDYMQISFFEQAAVNLGYSKIC